MNKIIHVLLLLTGAFYATAQTGTVGSPFTSLDQAAGVTVAGTYFFDLGGNTFDTHVDANGYVQVAIDFGNGAGDLPQQTSLTTAARGILTPARLAALSGIQEVRISSSTGNFDISTDNSAIIGRIQSNTTLHQGTADNAINDNWAGTNAGFMTGDASCTSSSGTSLHENIGHLCGNTGGFHWIPAGGTQRERFSNGEIANTASFQLWVKGTTPCTSLITSLHQAATITSPGSYCFDIGGNTFRTFVDGSGYVQVAIDFGNGTGNLPQQTNLNSTERGIFNPTILAALTETIEVRLSSSTGNFDIVTSDPDIISRVLSNTTLHQGTADNAINDGWTGTNAGFMTGDASCNSPNGTGLHQNVGHLCGNAGGFHWIPTGGTQRERFNSGEIANTASLRLWVKGDPALPIELLKFEATATNNHRVKLDFETATETNNAYFTIERSQDGINWDEVEELAGAGTTVTPQYYTAMDYSPYLGTSYYRLKQTDFDGSFSYSPIVSVTLSKSIDADISIFPNPTKDVLTIQGAQDVLGNISILNTLGQEVSSRISKVAYSNSTVIDLSNLETGIYLIRVANRTYKVRKL